MRFETCHKVPALYMAVYIPEKWKPEKVIICGFEGKPFERASFSYVFETPYICIDETTGECTEGDHCLNSSCRFNKTTPETYARYHDKPKEYVPQLKKKWLKLVSSMGDFCQSALKCMDAFKADPLKVPFFAIENGEIKKPLGQEQNQIQESNSQELSAVEKNDDIVDSDDKKHNCPSEVK
jgi:hypothetical protein